MKTVEEILNKIMENIRRSQKFCSFVLAAFLFCSFQYLSWRLVGIFSIASAASPTINFIGPTPSDGSGQAGSSITVKLQSSDEHGAHYTFADFDYDLRLWLRMDNISSGNPVDSSSYASSASKQGDAAQTNNGKFGKGFSFDGNGDYILISRPVENAFTICAWIKTPKAGVGIPHYLTAPVLESEAGGVAYDFGFGIDSNGKMAFGVGGISDITIHGSTTVINNQWHHVCSTRNNATGTLVLYVNGNQEATAAGNLGTLNANSQARIGNGTDGATGFQGTIDDLLVFKRVLSASEILSLYDGASNQYDHTFASLSASTHSFTGYSVDALGNMAQTTTRSVTTGVADVTPPSAPTVFNASATGVNVSLSWTNPTDNDFDSITIRRSTNGFPATPSSDTAVNSNNTGTSYADNDLADAIYYYSIFARDTAGNFSVAATVTATVDTTSPSAPTTFVAQVSGGDVALSWTNPLDGDFDSVTIRRSTSTYPPLPTDGVSISENNSFDFYTDTNVADGIYYYSIFAKDAAGNFSIAASIVAIVDTTAPIGELISPSVLPGSPTSLTSLPFVLTLSEDVNGLTEDDITVTNGNLNTFAVAITNTQFSFNIIPTSSGVVTVHMQSAKAQDDAGNDNTAVPEYSFTYIPVTSASVSKTGGGASIMIPSVTSSTLTPTETPVLKTTGNDNPEIIQNPTPTPPNGPFVDILNHWSHPYVIQLYNLKIIQGRELGKFVPDGNITRAEALKIGLLINDYPLDVQTPSGLRDLDAKGWYVPYLRKAKAEGFIKGTTFRPDQPITRIEALVMLLSIADKLEKTAHAPFKDISQKASYAPYVNYTYAKGVIIGRGPSGTLFAPDSPITRAEMAKLAIKIKGLSLIK